MPSIHPPVDLEPQERLKQAAALQNKLKELIEDTQYAEQKNYFEWLQAEITRVQNELIQAQQNPQRERATPFVFEKAIPSYQLTDASKKRELASIEQLKPPGRFEHVWVHMFIGGISGLLLAAAIFLAILAAIAITGPFGFPAAVFGIMFIAAPLIASALGIATGLTAHRSRMHQYEENRSACEAELNEAKPVHPYNIDELAEHKTFLGLFETAPAAPIDDQQDNEVAEPNNEVKAAVGSCNFPGLFEKPTAPEVLHDERPSPRRR